MSPVARSPLTRDTRICSTEGSGGTVGSRFQDPRVGRQQASPDVPPPEQEQHRQERDDGERQRELTNGRRALLRHPRPPATAPATSAIAACASGSA